jgi:hypothetical protein
LRTRRMKVFNSIGFIGLVVFCAVVLTSIVFSAPAPVTPPLTDYLAEWSWLMQAEPAGSSAGALIPPAVPVIH